MLIKEHGIRNAVMLTIAPTGTTAMVQGVSTGLEPIFSAIYKRRYKEGNVIKETVVVDPLFKEHFDNKLPLEYFVGAYEVTPKEHMAVQAACQKHIDSCISKTINMPEDANAASMLDEALQYASDLKGMTVYRAGSKGQEPLEAIPLTRENIEKYVKGGYDIAAAGAEVCSLNGGNCG